MVRSVVAVVLGIIFAVLVIAGVESIGSHVVPLPEGVNPQDMAAVRAAVANMPAGAFAFILFAWFLGTFIGAWFAARTAKRAPYAHAFIVGGVLLAAGIVSMTLLPHPSWVWIAGVACFLAAAYLGARLAVSAAS
jgi:hypothetical protein